jgi:hypothetical protein
MSEQRITTDRLTLSSLIQPGGGLLFGCLIETDGTNAATLTIYDNIAGSGKIMRKIIVPGADYYGGFELAGGLKSDNGIYATISGTGAAYWITYGSGF